MSKVASQTEVHQAQDVGSVLQCVVKADQVGLAATIAASSQIKSQVIPTNGFKYGGAAVKIDQAGQLSMQRYLDDAGTIPQGAAVTQALTANTWGVVNVPNDNLAFASIQLTITNSAATVANVLGSNVTLQAG